MEMDIKQGEQMRIVPKNDYVLVVELEEEKIQESGGILIPSDVSPKEFNVVDVGPDVENTTKNETILLAKGGGIEVKYLNTSYWIVKENEILATLK